MRTKHNFRKLEVWKRSRHFVAQIYGATNNFPSEEIFGLTRQIRRASISIPSNIAEGCVRGTDAELLRFCGISQGSAYELETQLFIAEDLGYLSVVDSSLLRKEVNEIQRMLHGQEKAIACSIQMA